jgi:hypothetical protein
MMCRMLELGDSQTAGDATAPQSLELQYASARERLPWGPLLFGPSLAACVLIVLTIVGATWLALRHHPWRLVARVPGSYDIESPFATDGLLITLDIDTGANLWNPATGELVRNVIPKLDAGVDQYVVVNGGEEVLALPHHDRVATFFDARTGRVLRRVPNPMALRQGRPTVYPDGSRVITNMLTSATLSLWDLSEKQQTSPPEPAGRISGVLPLVSPDSSRLIVRDPKGSGYTLLDAKNQAVIAHQPDARVVGFLGDDLLEVESNVSISRPAGPPIREIRSARDGRLLHAVDLSIRQSWIIVKTSPDARWVCASIATLAGGRFPGGPNRAQSDLQFFDVSTGKLAHRRNGVFAWLEFFPRSSRYITADPGSFRIAVFNPRHARPLAILPGAGVDSDVARVRFSPDGRTILLRTGGTTEGLLSIYRRAGWDCPESHLGAIAFPQTWLAAGSFVAAFVVLFANASRRGRAMPESPRAMALVVLAASLPLAAYSLLCACLGDFRQAMWPAPAALLVVAAIGLALGSRFWRLASLWTFAAALPYVLWLAYRLWRANPKGNTLYPLLDRHYNIPHLPLLIGLILAAALLALMLIALALSTRRPAA